MEILNIFASLSAVRGTSD